jgi:hypothetical protein
MSQQDIVGNDNDNTYPSQIPLKVFPEFCCLGVKFLRFSWLLLQGPQRRADPLLGGHLRPTGHRVWFERGRQARRREKRRIHAPGAFGC